MKRLLLGLSSSLPLLATADEVFLKNGGKLGGQVVSEDATTVVMDVGPGRVSVKRVNVLRIERGLSPVSAFRERAAALAADDVAGWLALASWARQKELATQAHEALEHVLRIDPQNAAANAALGRVESNGRWLSVEDSYRERGYVFFDGAWITSAEHEARLRADAADAAASAARRESDWRVREAEARAREAEAEARRAEAEADASYDDVPWGWGWGGWGWGGSVIVPPVRHHPRSNLGPKGRRRHQFDPPHVAPTPAPPVRPTRERAKGGSAGVKP